MAAHIEPLMTVEDLECMPEDGNRYEVIEGELFVSCAPGLPHQLLFGNIFGNLWDYLVKNPIGRVVATPGDEITSSLLPGFSCPFVQDIRALDLPRVHLRRKRKSNDLENISLLDTDCCFRKFDHDRTKKEIQSRNERR
jgi:hypothetical protein